MPETHNRVETCVWSTCVSIVGYVSRRGMECALMLCVGKTLMMLCDLGKHLLLYNY